MDVQLYFRKIGPWVVGQFEGSIHLKQIYKSQMRSIRMKLKYLNVLFINFYLKFPMYG